MLDFLKKNSMTSIILSVLFLIIGIILALNPNTVMSLMVYFFGITFMCVGLIKLICFFLNKNIKNSYSYELMVGIFFFALGIFIITCGETISALFRIIIGVWIIYTGAIKFINSFKLKGIGIGIWPLLFLMSVIMIITGTYVVLNSGTLLSALGIIMIIYSIMDLIQSIVFYFNISKM